MTDRHVGVLAPASPSPAAPPSVDPEQFALAMLEDSYEIAAGMEYVAPVLLLPPAAPEGSEEIVWPDGRTEVVALPSVDLPLAFRKVADLGAAEAVILSGDAPDLPALLIGKLFRALGRAPAAACQSTDGNGLVALAACLPLPAWLAEAMTDVDLDTPDALTRLRAAAPRPGLIPTSPGWHRLRAPGDLTRLDPALEGWEATRALLSGHPLP